MIIVTSPSTSSRWTPRALKATSSARSGSNDNMRKSVARGDVVAAGSVDDAEYIRYLTCISARVLPTSALWYTNSVVHNAISPMG
jgi:hypothetical protein